MKNMGIKATGFIAILVFTFSFVNCQGYKVRNSIWGDSHSLPPVIRVAFNGPTLVCDDLSGGNPDEVARRLQACFDRADSHGVVELVPGVHRVSRALLIQKPVRVTTQGLDETSPPCGENADARCAIIRAVSPMADISRSFFHIISDEVELNRIVVDGNRVQRYSSPEANACVRGDNGYGMNISASSNFLAIVGVTSTNALCGTGVEIGGGGFFPSNAGS